MKLRYTFFALLLFARTTALLAQSVSCEPNMDFELGNYSYWKFFQGTCCTPFSTTTVVTPPSTATAGRITVVSGTALDPYGGFPVVAPGGSYSLKLGTNDKDGKADKARYFVHVPRGTTNFALLYRYAIVMQDPGHEVARQPRFTVTTTDSATGATSGLSCNQFTYVAGSLPGFSVSSVSSSVYYKPWASAIIDLSGFEGRTIIVDFARGNCGYSAHFGYGYVDMSCGLFAIATNGCSYGATTDLAGPPGFQSYTWMDSNFTTILGTSQNITVTTPSVSTTYRLILTPYSGYGCPDTLTTRINIAPLDIAIATTDTALCKGSQLTLSPSVSGTAGPFTYNWSPSTGLSCTDCINPLLTATTAASYVLTVTDTNGCTKKDSVRVNVHSLPALTLDGKNKSMCSGNAVTLGAGGANTYTWTPSAGLSCSNCSNPIANPAATTRYIVTGTDTNQCRKSDTVTVKVNPLPVLSALDKAICSGDSVLLPVTGTGAGAMTYSWSPSTGLSCTGCPSPKTSPSLTTNYIVTGKDTNNCTNRDTVQVTVNALPVVLASPDLSVCKGDSASLSVSGARRYNWSPSTGMSCDTCATVKVLSAATAVYVVKGTDTNGCFRSDTVQVRVLTPPKVTIADKNKAVCIGKSTSLSVSGASTYSWSPSTGLSCTDCATPVASPLTHTYYIVRGTDANNCQGTDTVLVKANALPVLSPVADRTICQGDSASLTASASGAGTINYSWSPATALSCTACANPKAWPATTTNYIVSVRDTNLCEQRDTVQVTVHTLPDVVASPDQSVCKGDTAALAVSGARRYSWSPSSGLACDTCTTIRVAPATRTVYVVKGTDTNGCSRSDTVNVNILALPKINLTDKITGFCVGTSVKLGVSGASTYSWSPSAGLSCTDCASPVASPITNTYYVVTGTDTNRCRNKDTVLVKVNALPELTPMPDKTICFGDSASLFISATGSGALTYSWSPAISLSCTGCPGPKASPKAVTDYVVVVTDTNKCERKDTVRVNVNILPVLAVSPDPAICKGDSTLLSASGAVTNYRWSPSSGLVCDTCATTKASPSVTTRYIITARDTNGCSGKDTLNLKVNPLPELSIAYDRTICKGLSTSLSVSGAERYRWSPSAGLACDTCAVTIARPFKTTTYKVRAIDANGCMTTDSISIHVNEALQVSVDTVSAICEGDSSLFRASGSVSYEWFPAGALSCPTCASTYARPIFTTLYRVVSTDGNGCKDTAFLNQVVNPKPELTLTADTQICEGTSLRLSAWGAKTYSWSPSAGLSCTDCRNPMAKPGNDTRYIVQGVDEKGCADTASVMLSMFRRQPVNVGPGDTVCEGETVSLWASGGTRYKWSPAYGLSSDEVSNPVIVQPDSSIRYRVIIQQGSCFTDTAYVNVLINRMPEVILSGDSVIYAGEQAHLHADLKYVKDYRWSPAQYLDCISCPQPVAKIGETTTFTLAAKGDGDCETSADFTVRVKCDQGKIFIPNTFTPNGDGENDRFYPMGSGVKAVRDFVVYNRWGEIMYEAHNILLNDVNTGWDGTCKGRSLNADVFVYYLNATCNGGDEIILKGNISLVK